MLSFSDFFKINNSRNLLYKLKQMTLLFEGREFADLVTFNSIPCPANINDAEDLINGGPVHRISFRDDQGKPIKGWDEEFKKAAIVIMSFRILALLGASGHSVGQETISKDTPGYCSGKDIKELENKLVASMLRFIQFISNKVYKSNTITNSLMSSPADFALACATKLTRDTNRYMISLDRESLYNALKKLLIDDPDNFWKRIRFASTKELF